MYIDMYYYGQCCCFLFGHLISFGLLYIVRDFDGICFEPKFIRTILGEGLYW